MSKGRRVPPKHTLPSKSSPLYVVGPWVRSPGSDIEQNAGRLIDTGWRYWATLAHRGYATEGQGVVAIKLEYAGTSSDGIVLPDAALMIEATWVTLDEIHAGGGPQDFQEIETVFRDAVEHADPSTSIVFSIGYHPDKKAFMFVREVDVPHEHYAEQIERGGLVDRNGVIGAFDLISGLTTQTTTPSA